MKKIKQYIPWIIRILISVLFLLSAFAKLYPSPNVAIPTFVAKQLIPLGFDQCLGAYFLLTLISLEFALGIAILLPYLLKKVVIPLTILVLTKYLESSPG